MGVIERIVDVADNQLKYLEAKDCVENNIDIGSITHADIFLSSIAEFYNLRLTKENFAEHKSRWIYSLGNLEK